MNRIKKWLKEAAAAVALVVMLALVGVVLAVGMWALLVGLLVMVVSLPLAAMTGTLKVTVKDEKGKEKEVPWRSLFQ